MTFLASLWGLEGLVQALGNRQQTFWLTQLTESHVATDFCSMCQADAMQLDQQCLPLRLRIKG